MTTPFTLEAPKPALGPGGAAPLSFARDSNRRRKLFHPDSFKHHAKANLFMLGHILARYTRPGDLVLDPMGGTGSLFIGAAARRRVLCGEIEHWLRPILAANAQRAASWGQGGRAWGVQWDAGHLPVPCESVGAIVTSPPYWDTFSDWHISSNRLMREQEHVGPYGSAYGDDRYNQVKRNLGNIHTYEHFLRAMRPVFQECWRVLQPGGVLALIVKDRIHRGRRVPISSDLAGLCRAIGFDDLAWNQVHARLTQYRQLHKAKGLQLVEDEQIIVMRKADARISTRWALVGVPDKYGPPWIVYQKAMKFARSVSEHVWAFSGGLLTMGAPFPEDDDLKTEPAHVRRGECNHAVLQLTCRGLRAGDRVDLHVPERYALYLQERLESFGCEVDNPTAHLNMGQKMTWYTERQV